MADPYTVLGISPTASKAEIKAAFRKKAMAHHPDMHSTAPEGVKKAHDAAFKALNEAYQALMDDSHRYRQRAQAARGGFARGSYAGSYYAGSSAGAGANHDPFSFYYGSGTGSRYSGWRQYQRRRGLDFAGLFRSFEGLSRAGAAATATLGVLVAGGVLLLEPLTGALWERNNEGKLFSSIEADYARRKQQQQQQQHHGQQAVAAPVSQQQVTVPAAASAGIIPALPVGAGDQQMPVAAAAGTQQQHAQQTQQEQQPASQEAVEPLQAGLQAATVASSAYEEHASISGSSRRVGQERDGGPPGIHSRVSPPAQSGPPAT